MKTSVIYSLLLLGSNASAISAQEAAKKVLRGSSKIVDFEDYVKDNAQLDETQCLGCNSICVESSQCCGGFVCSGRLCRPSCGGTGSFCLSGSECCSGRCAGLVCTRPSSQCTVGDVAEELIEESRVEDVSQELIEESHEAQKDEDSDMKEEIEDLLARRCKYNGEVCLDSSQCCNGLVCSGSRCRTSCGGGGNLCFNGADCCSGLCSGFRCRS